MATPTCTYPGCTNPQHPDSEGAYCITCEISGWLFEVRDRAGDRDVVAYQAELAKWQEIAAQEGA